MTGLTDIRDRTIVMLRALGVGHERFWPRGSRCQPVEME